MKSIFAGILAFFLPFYAFAYDVFPHEFHVEVLNTQINVGTYAPRRADAATVIYLHGYGDTMNNHEELLSQLHGGGMRVLSFDYPSHGKSKGTIFFWSIDDVAEIVHELLNSPVFRAGPLAVNRQLPVILVGWSTGATIAIRTAQSWGSRVIPEDMRLAGVIGFAPGLPARAFVGDGISRLGMKVKAEDLTRNPAAMKYPPNPDTTVLDSGRFAATLKVASEVAYWKGAPNVPMLMFVADHQKDFFADAKSSAHWVNSAGKQLPTFGFQCRGSFHGMEFEPDGIGELTRLLAIEFAQRLAQPDVEKARQEIELGFRSRYSRACPQVHQR